MTDNCLSETETNNMLIRGVDVKIPLVPRVKFESLPKQDLTFTKQDGSKHKRKIQIASDEDVVSVLRVIEEVVGAMEQLAFDGPAAHRMRVRKESFRLCLLGAPRDIWDQSVLADDTIVAWNQSLKAFLSELMVVDDDLRRQKEYLKNLKLPDGYTVTQSISLLRNMFKLMAYMPQEDEGVYPTDVQYTDEDIKDLLLAMVPTWLQSKFEEQSLTSRLADLSLIQFAHWLDNMINLKASNRTPVDTNEGGSRRSGKRSRRNGGNGGGQNNNHGGNGNARKKLKANNDANVCKYHGGHTWEQCFGNPKGPRYKPGFKLDKSKLKKKNNNGGGNNGGGAAQGADEDQHMIVDVTTEEPAPAQEQESESEVDWDQAIGAVFEE
ncbi:hypothetical protein MPSEU_000737600 [Mayamaea pseudoterrestris]|nr:hypothetical protein MPSEU_000737600 [Mayamaea pseudoterrestris]